MLQNTKCYKVLHVTMCKMFKKILNVKMNELLQSTKCYSVLNVTKYQMFQSTEYYKVLNITKYFCYQILVLKGMF